MIAAFFVLLAACIIMAYAFVRNRARLTKLEREHFIRAYEFPARLLNTLSEKHHHLDEKDKFLVARALREFFLIRARAGSRLIGMPSKVVDDLWHEFILHTRDYQTFCDRAFGQFFHHVPASSIPKGADLDAATQLSWRYACREENINLARPTRLPLLFAIDAKLNIAGGNHYNTKYPVGAKRNADSCGASSCGGISCGGDSGSCGGGCGGD